MNIRFDNRLAWFALLVAVLWVGAARAAGEPEFEPHIGQPGKDVIWVPTPVGLIDRMLRMAQTTPRDVVIDLGSGDGRTVIAAAKTFGARAMGIEYNADLVALSQHNAERAGVAATATFVKADLFESDFSQATVITMYLLPSINAKLKPKLLGLKPGTRIVSHAFGIADWIPDQVDVVAGRRGMLWIVPARVAGDWKLNIGGGAELELTFDQRHQIIEGLVQFPAIKTSLRDARLQGDRISFSLMDAGANLLSFSGRVAKGRMEGTARSALGAQVRWVARLILSQ